VRTKISGLKKTMTDELAEVDEITSRKIGKLANFSQSCSYKILIELKGKWKKIRKQAYLSETGMKRRVQMATKLSDMKKIWGENFHRNVLWTDESSVQLGSNSRGNRGAYRRQKDTLVLPQKKHPRKIMAR
jgi:hypothetical protein